MPAEQNNKSKSDSEKYHVPNLDRALSILELLSRHPKGLIKNEITKALSLPANSVYRITTTLVNRGYLGHNEKTRRLSLTTKMMDLCISVVDDESLVDKSWDVMCKLRDLTTETVHLETILGNEGVILEEAKSLHSLRYTVGPGVRFELHAPAPGKVMLAFLDEKSRSHIISNMKFTRFTDKTITDRDKFLAELKKVAKQGYALDLAEIIEGTHCVSAPIIGKNDRAVAALTVSGPAGRLPENKLKEIAGQVIIHADQISRKLS